MYLNMADKNKLRRMIEEKVVNVPNGKRIKIDKNLLENLLFVKELDIHNRKAKFIVWTGNFLNKIDLSEISFDNAVWDLRFCEKYEKMFKTNPYNDIKNINLNNTNVKIDFSKSYDNIYTNASDRSISNSNFENVKDIVGFDIFRIIINCNLKNSGAIISFDEKRVLGKKIIDTNLEGINLYDSKIDVSDLVSNTGKNCIHNCNLKNTNISVNYNFKRPINYQDNLNTYYRLKEKEFKTEPEQKKFERLSSELKNFIKIDEYGVKLGQLINDGKLEGCYVNDKYIKSKELANKDRKKRIEELKREKEELISSLEKDIDTQILSFKKVNSGAVIVRM